MGVALAAAGMSSYAVLLAARMSSERLPGKALADYSGEPNLAQIIRRWHASRRAPQVIVVTSDDPGDAPIVALCRRLGVACYPAPAALVAARDVLAQLDGALRCHAPNAQWVARALSDNPLVDVGLADLRFDMLAVTGADGFRAELEDVATLTYAGTTDVWSRRAWDRLVVEGAADPVCREHVGTWWWSDMERPGFHRLYLPLPRREFFAPVRTELDTPQDLALFQAVWDAFRVPCVPTLDALAWLNDHPEVVALNAGVELKTQTAPSYGGRGVGWHCEGCRRRIGTIVEGDLALHCPHCGQRRKFYAQKPRRK